ncbi:MAG TPA: carbohydrate ABC transporter permease [Kofleriaceae bacterium]|jgi:raffinose/stachyose/melibiose transport system permease protein|nr:carbohydrate ABC transporter permease [Kofleriaceae bacterium]
MTVRSAPRAPRATGRRRMAVLHIALVLFALTQLFPLVWVVLYSLQRSGDLFGNDLLKLPADPQWHNYARAWTDGQIVRYGLNSLIVVTASTVVSTVLAFCMGYALARMRWRLKRFAVAAVVLGMVVPVHATLLPNFIWYGIFGLIDTRLGLVIPYVAFTLSFNTLVYASHFESLPDALEEAALIDGASWPRILWTIIAPLATPATVTVAVMTFLSGWNEFIMANTYLASDELRTLPFSVIRFEGQYSSDYAVQFACMVIVAVPALALYLFFSKHIMAGATAGSVKG